MKRFCFVALLAMFSSTAFAKVSFDHWSVSSDGTQMFNIFSGKDYNFGVLVSNEGFPTVHISKNVKLSQDDRLITKGRKVIMVVNGQKINGSCDDYADGVTSCSIVTTKGQMFFVDQLWKKSKVDIKVDGFEIWASAKGVQKAWAYLRQMNEVL